MPVTGRVPGGSGPSSTAGRPAAGAPARVAGARLPRRLAPRKRPRQARAQETVAAMLQAAVDLFAAEGYARTTTNRIAERAGVSIGSLYQYFPNKDALLTALHERHLAAVEAVLARSLAELAEPATPLERGLRGLVEGLVAAHDADPKLTRAVSFELPQVPRLDVALRKHERARLEQVEALLRGRPDVRAGDRAVMARVLGQTTEALTRWLVHERPAEVDRATACEEIVRLLAGYLRR